MRILEDSVYSFSKDHPPVIRAVPGDALSFRTKDCFAGQIHDASQTVAELDLERVNPATGPVFIAGAKPGDVLVADILDIRPASRGFACSVPDTGPLAYAAEIRTKVIDVADGIAGFNDVKWHVTPMIGVVGTAPDGDAVACGFAGNHGGNMDCKLITKGARLYLPVRVPGALFQLGDLHASMGDGEICGTGVEIAGEVDVRFDITERFELNWPLIETPSAWYINTTAPDYQEALKLASVEISRLMSPVYGWDLTDIFIYLSLNGQVEVNQGCFPSSHDMFTLRFGVPKNPDKGPLIR